MYPLDSKGQNPGLQDYTTVCWDCFEWVPERELDKEVEKSVLLRNVDPGFSTLYTKAILRTLTEKTRLFVYAGRLLFLRRLTVIVVAITSIVVCLLCLVTLVGALFVSAQAGLQWATGGLQVVRHVAAFAIANPWLPVLILSAGYLVHITERERDYHLGVRRERRRGGGRNLPDYTANRWARWQVLAGFTAVALLGTADWLLLSTGLREGSRFGASLLWFIGASGIAYSLRAAVHEDRDASGFGVQAAPWVFTSRIALGLGIIHLASTLVAERALLAELLTLAGFYLVPLVSSAYVLRRSIERRTGWRLQIPPNVRSSFTEVIGRKRPSHESPDDQHLDRNHKE